MEPPEGPRPDPATHSPAEATTAETTAAEAARWRALVLCLVAGAMTLLDVSIVNVALPSVQEGLGAGQTAVQWIVAGYSLAFGMVLVPAGRLGDARSRRAVFAAGVGLFTLASAACGAANDPTTLAVARVVQGVGGGLLTPQVSGFIQTLFRGKERARAFGLFGATIGVSTALGPLLGGALVQLGGEDLGWRLVFFVNVPIGVALLVLIPRWLPKAEQGPRQSLDPVGVLLFGAAVLFVLLPLVEGQQDQPLSQRPWWLLGVAAALLLTFAAWERWWRSGGRASLVDPPVLRIPSYVLGLLLGTFYFAGFTSIFLVVTLYLQTGLGYSALEAGATQMPFAIGSAVSAYLGGRLVTRLGRPLVVGGVLLVAVGLVAIDLLVPHLSGDVGLKLAPAFFVAGLGSGFVISPNITLALASVDPRNAGSGGGMLQTVQRVGSAIGVAVVLAQYFDRLASSGGDYAEALSYSLHTTLVFVGLALAVGVVDLLRGRRTPPARHAAQPAHAAH